MDNSEKRYLTIEDVMKITQLSRDTIERELKRYVDSNGQKGLRSRRIGRVYRIDLQWLTEYMELPADKDDE